MEVFCRLLLSWEVHITELVPVLTTVLEDMVHVKEWDTG